MEKSRQELGVPQSALDDQAIMYSHPRRKHQSFAEKLNRDDVYKPLIATVVLSVMNSFAGAHQVLVHESANKIYAVNNIRAHHGRNAFFLRSLIFGSNIVLAIVIPYLGFKKMVYIGLTLLSISLVLYAGMYASNALHLKDMIIVMISLSFDVGMFNLNYMLLAYVFPVDAKGLSSIGLAVVNLLSPFAMICHPFLRSILDFWIYVAYAVLDVLIIIWVRHFLPEVAGKTQSEIRHFFFR